MSLKILITLYYLGPVSFIENDFMKITFQTFLYLFVTRKVIQQKILSSQRKNWLGFQESVFFFFISGRKHFPEVMKKLEMSCYLLIISNLVLKLLIAIYFILNLFF
jgi:hypothetical protein